MAELPPQMANALKYIAQFFQVKPEWLLFPNIVTVFAIPLILNILMIYFILKRVMGFFGRGINMAISAVIGFLLLPFNEITMFIAPAIIGFLGFQKLWAKIFVIALLYAVEFVIIPLIFQGAFFRFPSF
jgi:hypothetical protein